MSLYAGYQNVVPNVCLRVPSSLMYRPNPICHLISCPVFLAALAVPFSLLLTQQVTHVIKKNRTPILNSLNHHTILCSLH